MKEQRRGLVCAPFCFSLQLVISDLFWDTGTFEDLHKAKDSFPRKMHVHFALCILSQGVHESHIFRIKNAGSKYPRLLSVCLLSLVSHSPSLSLLLSIFSCT